MGLFSKSNKKVKEDEQPAKGIDDIVKDLNGNYENLVRESLNNYFDGGLNPQTLVKQTRYLSSIYLINLAQFYQTKELIELLKQNPKT